HTNVPDALVLVLLGILIGPVLGIADPQDFGKVGPVVATIALVVILFESGTSLDAPTLRRTAGTTGLLTLSCFVLSAATVTVVAHGVSGLDWLPAAMLGATLGGTASAVVIPAALIGVVGGVGWLFVLGHVRGFPNTISSTLAYVFIVYGTTEVLGFSGAIAALALGVALSNHQHLGLERIASAGLRIEPLNCSPCGCC
ncbi:MAG: cation:proton antiporter, partial [Burkholderiaceae bacterium]|nr:cation:proton antiporter [Burkholderiaceae bacterium]